MKTPEEKDTKRNEIKRRIYDEKRKAINSRITRLHTLIVREDHSDAQVSDAAGLLFGATDLTCITERKYFAAGSKQKLKWSSQKNRTICLGVRSTVQLA